MLFVGCGSAIGRDSTTASQHEKRHHGLFTSSASTEFTHHTCRHSNHPVSICSTLRLLKKNTTPKCRSQNETAPGQLNPVPRLTTDQIPLRKPLSRKDRAATPSHLQQGQRAASIRDYLERKEREKKKKTPIHTAPQLQSTSGGVVLARDPYRRVKSRASQMRNWRTPIGALDRGNRAARQAAIPDRPSSRRDSSNPRPRPPTRQNHQQDSRNRQ